ncbi:MAG: hypothetical protein ACXV2C_02320 [Candidatus Bathyarchaeia archaeon]
MTSVMCTDNCKKKKLDLGDKKGVESVTWAEVLAVTRLLKNVKLSG